MTIEVASLIGRAGHVPDHDAASARSRACRSRLVIPDAPSAT
ncbi:MAG TPA: hypothetical protein VJ351_27010 [Streptosporangiaceae bacterium]|nr:hypothetical protein [Streptosporangiaceae bacterium]